MNSDRHTAATLLRQCRHLAGAAACEAVAWARCAAPESLPALKLEARLALASGDIDAADALIAQGLLLRPNDPALLTLHAERLLERGCVGRAVDLINRAIGQRPWHAGSRLIAGRIAMAIGDRVQAEDHLRAAAHRNPAFRDAALGMLADAALREGDLERARGLMEQTTVPSPLLVADLLRSEHRLLDALETLESALDQDPANDALLEKAIDLADESGDVNRVRALVLRAGPSLPRALLRSAETWLRLGEFETVIARLKPLTGGTRHARAALRAMTVAASMLDCAEDAEKWFMAEHRSPGSDDPVAYARLWRAGIMGSILRQERRPPGPDRGGAGGLLESLLPGADRPADPKALATNVA